MLKKISSTIFSLTMIPALVSAEVVRDGSIGPDASVQANGPDYVIDESMGERAGSNLFHSFSKSGYGLYHEQGFVFISALVRKSNNIRFAENKIIKKCLKNACKHFWTLISPPSRA